MCYSRATIGLAFILIAGSRVAAQETPVEPAPPAQAETFRVGSVPNRFDDVAAIRLTHAAGAVAFSPTEKLLVTADRDGNRLRAWNSETGELAWVETLAVPGFKALSFTRDGAHLMLDFAEPGPDPLRVGVAVLEVASRRLVWQSAPVEGATAARTLALDVSPDDQVVAISKEGDIQIRGLATGNLIQTLRGHLARVDVLLFSPDSKRLLSATRGEQVCLWDVPTGERMAKLAFPQVGNRAIAFLQDQTPVVLTDSTKDLFDIVDVETGQPFARASAKGSRFDELPERHATVRVDLDPLALTIVSPDRKSFLAAIGAPCIGPFLILFSAESGNVVGGVVPDDQFQWDRCGFSPDSRWAFAVVTADPRGRVGDLEPSLLLWNAVTGEVMARLQPPGGVLRVQFSADGSTAAIVGKQHVWLWKDVSRPEN